jgi:UDP-GlcNAc:undecaprenyl-phosphate GlcNAc-1-phosphate transferase
MTNILGAALATAAAAGIVLVLTPWLARLARRLGAVDRPDGNRKHQSQPVPRGGGIAVAIATLAGVLIAVLCVSSGAMPSAESLVGGLAPAAVILLVVGIIDDFWSLTGIYKLVGQMLAVSVLVAGGRQFEFISLFGYHVPLGDFRIPFAMFFALGAINAFNLVDGVDGLAASLGAIVSVTLGIITAAQSHWALAITCFALAGALAGFLRYNLAPARVYLGDTGSMLIGLVVAAVAIESSIKQQAAFALAVPLAAFAIPILDAGAALVRRITTGQSVFKGDRGHLHHALLLRGCSVNQTVAIIAALTTLTCLGALASFFTGYDVFAFALASGIVLFLAGRRIFGHAEAALVAKRSLSLGRKLLSRGPLRPQRASESTVQLQGSRAWQTLWTALREAAPNYRLAGLTLQVSIPYLHESFFAEWKANQATSAGEPWRLTLPLALDDRPIGKLTVLGMTSGREALADLEQLCEYLEFLHDEILQIITPVAVGEANWQTDDALAPTLN